MLIAFAFVALVGAGTALAVATKLGIRAESNSQGAAISNDAGLMKHAGVGGSSGWVLVVDPTTAANGASADLTVTGKINKQKIDNGVVLTELGFDLYTPLGFDVFDRGSLCGTSTRFDFENSATGGVYSLNCNEGTHTNLGGGWTRVRYTNNAQVDTLAGPAWPGYGTAVVDFIQLMNDGADGGGVAVIDNIDVNGNLIGS
jgi:hypothetical protein